MNGKPKAIKGFTLIELLVVISIIGILASITLAALSSARASGLNGRIIEEVTQMRAQMEQSWDGTSYSVFGPAAYGPAIGGSITSIVAAKSFTDLKMVAILNDILNINQGQYGGGGASGSACNTGNTLYNADINSVNLGFNGLTIYVYPSCAPVTKYAIYAAKLPLPLVNSPDHTKWGGYFCVDSSGHAISSNDGWIPGYTEVLGPNGYLISKNINDGECH